MISSKTTECISHSHGTEVSSVLKRTSRYVCVAERFVRTAVNAAQPDLPLSRTQKQPSADNQFVDFACYRTFPFGANTRDSVTRSGSVSTCDDKRPRLHLQRLRPPPSP